MVQMKRINLLLAGVLFAMGSLYAQTSDTEWKAGVEKLKATIQSNPDQAEDVAKELVKGKNKKNIDLLVAIGKTYLDAGDMEEAQEYAKLGRKADRKSAQVSLLEGDIAIALKDPGTASQKYEEAILFDDKCVEAYVKFADIYKRSNPDLAISKLEDLRTIEPNNIEVDRKLADVYYTKNDYNNAAEAYARFATKPEATERDLARYSFVLFLKHDFEKSLEIANMGLQKNSVDPTFNRLAMYNNVDLKRYDEAMKAADIFFKECPEADYSYLDYKYHGYLLDAVKKYDQAAVSFEKAIELDSTQVDLYKNISEDYENLGNYKNAITFYKKYFNSLEPAKQTPDLQYEIGKLCYGAGTQSDSLTITMDERKAALVEADTIFSKIATLAPDNYLGNFWRARVNVALDPDATQGLAKPFYEQVAALIESKNDPRYNNVLIECYNYLGYYYLVNDKLPESKEYWNKILAVDSNHAVAKKALEGLANVQ